MSIRVTSLLIAMIASVTAINASVPNIVGYGKGRQAVKDAKAACSIMAWKDENMIDTLAAAYAETGDFDSAARYAAQALAIKGIEPADSKRIQRHLALFQQHQPIRL
jgi:Flp pilus assembly protein TadD